MGILEIINKNKENKILQFLQWEPLISCRLYGTLMAPAISEMKSYYILIQKTATRQKYLPRKALSSLQQIASHEEDELANRNENLTAK